MKTYRTSTLTLTNKLNYKLNLITWIAVLIIEIELYIVITFK